MLNSSRGSEWKQRHSQGVGAFPASRTLQMAAKWETKLIFQVGKKKKRFSKMKIKLSSKISINDDEFF